MARIELQSSYVLHTRHFRDSSLIVELFTHEFGRVSVIAKGARRSKSRTRGVLQAFTPLMTSWIGRTDLMTLTSAELKAMPLTLTAHALYSGLYMNELLLKLLHRHDPHPNLFDFYARSLQDLVDGTNNQSVLRLFEKRLLSEIGYGLQLVHEADSNILIQDEHYYVFNPEFGFSVIKERVQNPRVFSGVHLIAIANDDYSDDVVQRDAKRLMRIAISHLLGDKTIRSRDLFVRYSS